MKRWLKEPLLHFLLLGMVIFAAYRVVSRGAAGEGGSIVITQGQLASMREGFTRTRQREPTSEEWEGLIRARVREEVYYREALALSLDKDDAVIRRRLQQKMEFISDDVAAEREPTEVELHAYLQAHPDTFRVEPRFTFRQVYLNPEKHGASLARDAAQLLARVNDSGSRSDVSALGDSFLLGQQFRALTASDIARQFGDGFSKAVGGLSLGKWHGPVDSNFGVHLVFVSERQDARAPALAEVRGAVRREWETAQLAEVKEQRYREMLERYTVTVENLAPVQPTLASMRAR